MYDIQEIAMSGLERGQDVTGAYASLDASAIFSLSAPRVDALHTIISASKALGSFLVIDNSVVGELGSARHAPRVIVDSEPRILKSSTSKDELDWVKRACIQAYKPIHAKRDNDYRVLAAAIRHSCLLLVTDDYDLLISSRKFRERQGIPNTALTETTPEGLVLALAKAGPRVLSAGAAFEIVLNLSIWVGVPRMFDHATKLRAPLKDIQSRLESYGSVLRQLYKLSTR